MKKIYLVRHGESSENAGSVWNGHVAKLTEKGVSQAKFLASRSKSLPIEKIISSPLPRTKQTAEIINEKLNLEIDISELFAERRWPSEQQGLAKDHPQAKEIQETVWNNFYNDKFRYSDEENFTDLKERVKKSLQFLEKQPEKEILVVTHDFFLRAFLAYVVLGENLSAEECAQFIDKFYCSNVGLFVLCYNEKGKRTPWTIQSWNDLVHLAE